MKKNEIVVGGKYIAKVSGKLTTVRVDAIRDRYSESAFIGKTTTVYDVTNLRTGRKITFRSAAKFRSAVDTTAETRHNAPKAIANRAAEDALVTPSMTADYNDCGN